MGKVIDLSQVAEFKADASDLLGEMEWGNIDPQDWPILVVVLARLVADHFGDNRQQVLDEIVDALQEEE